MSSNASSGRQRSSEASSSARDSAQGRRSIKRFVSSCASRFLGVVRVVAIAAIVIVLATASGFAAQHWLYGDDAQDIQGQWYVNGTAVAISITESEMALAEDVAYQYAIDDVAKEIDFSFGVYEGEGHYRFSLDRGELAIIDGSFTTFEVLLSDFIWLLKALASVVTGEELLPATGENVTILSREVITIAQEDPAASSEGGEGQAPAEEDSADASASPDEAAGSDEVAGIEEFSTIIDDVR